MSFKSLVIIAISLFFCSAAWADEIECESNKVKTCFVDGSAPSCLCVDPAPVTGENPPNEPDEPGVSTGE
jgi:hypothetical protein